MYGNNTIFVEKNTNAVRILLCNVLRVVTSTHSLNIKNSLWRVFLCLSRLFLAVLSNQSYLYVTPPFEVKDMLNQQDMTETEKAVFNELSDKPATAGEIVQDTHLTRERCQLILTQLAMAGLSEYQFGCYKRLQ